MVSQIRSVVTGQALVLEQELIVTGTKSYLTADFTFSPEWDGMSIWAKFSLGSQHWDINLHNGKILQEDRLNLTTGTWELSLLGLDPNGLPQVTTEPRDLRVRRTNIDPLDPIGEVPAVPADQIDRKAQKAMDIAAEVQRRADEGEFDFRIEKVYPSVEAMEADFDNPELKEGANVLIETGNPDDVDNSKWFVKGSTQWEFVGDLSGAAGIKGPPGKDYDHSEEFTRLSQQVRDDAVTAETAAQGAAGSAQQAGASAEQAQTDTLTATGAAQSAKTEAGRAKSEADRSAAAAAVSVAHGITGAKVGDLMQITAVDEKGVPTELKPTTLEELEGKYEHITAIEVSEDMVVRIDKYPDGQPLKLKAIKALCSYDGTPTELKSSSLWVNASDAWMAFLSWDFKNNAYCMLDASISGGLIKTRNCKSDSLYSLGAVQGGAGDSAFKPATSIKRFFSSNSVPAGTKIEIWGVRA